MSGQKSLRVGIIGLGMGRHHILGYKEHAGAEIVAIADLDPARLKSVGEEFHIAARYTDVAEMLSREKPDLVSVAVPNKFHKELTIQALKAGCHVLCEKPMAMNAAEAEEMIAAARKAGKRLMINFSFRFSQQGRALKAQVDTGILGQVYYGRTVWHRRRGIPGFGGWFTNKELSGGGPLIDLGVHRLDLALWLMGYPSPEWVIGSTYDHIASKLAREQGKKYTVEDLAAGFIKFKNGASLVVEASWATNSKENEFMETRLLGTEAGLVHRNINETYEFEGEIYLERAGCQFDMKIHPPVPAFKSSMHHFTEAILTGQPHIAPGEEGATVMRILDSIYESARTGKPVHL